jgi:hypothetical protein
MHVTGRLYARAPVSICRLKWWQPQQAAVWRDDIPLCRIVVDETTEACAYCCAVLILRLVYLTADTAGE